MEISYSNILQPNFRNEPVINQSETFDIFENVFSESQSLQGSTTASSFENTKCIDATKNKEYFLITKLAKFFSAHLNQELYQNQINQLLSLESDTTILRSTNLLEIKTSSENFREQILHLLKTIENEDLENLKNLSQNEKIPAGFEKLFDLVKIYKEIDEVQSSGFDEWAEIWEISVRLMVLGHPNKSLEIIKTLEDLNTGCGYICLKLMKKGLTNETIAVAKLITKEHDLIYTLSQMCLPRVVGGDYKKTIKVVEAFIDTNNPWYHRFLMKISNGLRMSGDHENQNEVLAMIPEKERDELIWESLSGF